MAARTEIYPAIENAGGTVPNNRRAAALKRGIAAYTLAETVGVKARWDEDQSSWIIEFEDET